MSLGRLPGGGQDAGSDGVDARDALDAPADRADGGGGGGDDGRDGPYGDAPDGAGADAGDSGRGDAADAAPGDAFDARPEVDSARPDAGTVAWIKDGMAVIDDVGRLFLSVDAPARKSFMHVGWDTGEKAADWSYTQGTLAFRCFVANEILLEGQDGLFAFAKTGAFEWSTSVQGNRACWSGAGLYTETDTDLVQGRSYVYTFRPGPTSLDPAWTSNDETAGTAVVRADATTIYLSSYAGGRTHLKAVRLADGSAVWPQDALFTSSVMVGFTFDDQGNLFNNADPYLQSSTVSRVDPRTGSIVWTYRPPADQFADVRVDGAAGFALAREGRELLAIDKQDGHERWRANVDPNALYATWYPTLLASHDVLITGEVTLQADDNHMLRVGHSLVDQAGVVRWTVGPAPVLLTFNGSNRGQFVWEGAPGQLYSTSGGAIAKLDAAGQPMWTFDLYAFERAIGEVGDVVLAAGPPRNCWPCDEGVYAIDKASGKLRWQMQGQFQSGMSLFTSDADRIYLRVPPTGMYEPSRTAAVWR
ncbi:MAG TPA: PQQ-binding-like beta-propeller repeat protein [Candidatus Polarisedimenticolia bacterium]|nr:PQQ-binding-like beta-propeller repeat protein [Candidatus Polarisedimenticolia bacterium]